MSDNDCCGMLLSCCVCCSVCTHDSDSSCIRAIISIFPESWCGRLKDTAAEDAVMAERDREAALFQTSSQNSSQPEGTPTMSMKTTSGGPNLRDKSLIMSDLE
ncbi:hypothetical protein C8R46DRAFT_1209596 [Mycena filopes]|nr:hypothetical protein C8R46DRAFT_1209596 [Mycena filopes]